MLAANSAARLPSRTSRSWAQSSSQHLHHDHYENTHQGQQHLNRVDAHNSNNNNNNSRNRDDIPCPMNFSAFAIQGRGGRRLRLQTKARAGNGSSLTWESPPRVSFPQEILLDFPLAQVHEMRILCHPAKTPSSALIFIGKPGEDPEQLGRVEFANGVANCYTTCEVKCISIQRTCSFVHIVIEGCFGNAYNVDMQAQISGLVVIGQTLANSFGEDIEDFEQTQYSQFAETPRTRTSRVQDAMDRLQRILEGPSPRFDRQQREQAEHMKQRLESLETAKDRAVAAEDFARAAELKVSLQTLAGRALVQLDAALRKQSSDLHPGNSSARSLESAASFRAAQKAAKAVIFGPQGDNPFSPQPETNELIEIRRSPKVTGPLDRSSHYGDETSQALVSRGSSAKRIRPKVNMPASLIRGGLRLSERLSERNGNPVPRIVVGQESNQRNASEGKEAGLDSLSLVKVGPNGNEGSMRTLDTDPGTLESVLDPDNANEKNAFPIENWDLALSSVTHDNQSDHDPSSWSRRSMSDRSESSEYSTDELREVESAQPIENVPQSSRDTSPLDQLEHQLRRVIEESIRVDAWEEATREYAELARRGLASGRPKAVTLGLDLLEVVALRFAELSEEHVQEHHKDLFALLMTCTDLLRDEDTDGLLHARITKSMQTLVGTTQESATIISTVFKSQVVDVVLSGEAQGKSFASTSLAGQTQSSAQDLETLQGQAFIAHQLEVLDIFMDAVSKGNPYLVEQLIDLIKTIPVHMGPSQATALQNRSFSSSIEEKNISPKEYGIEAEEKHQTGPF